MIFLQIAHQRRGHVRKRVVAQRSKIPALAHKAADVFAGDKPIGLSLPFGVWPAQAVLLERRRIGQRALKSFLGHPVIAAHRGEKHRLLVTAGIVNFKSRSLERLYRHAANYTFGARSD